MLRFAKRSVSVTKTAAATEIADFRYMFLARLSVSPSACGFSVPESESSHTPEDKTYHPWSGVESSNLDSSWGVFEDYMATIKILLYISIFISFVF